MIKFRLNITTQVLQQIWTIVHFLVTTEFILFGILTFLAKINNKVNFFQNIRVL